MAIVLAKLKLEKKHSKIQTEADIHNSYYWHMTIKIGSNKI